MPRRPRRATPVPPSVPPWVLAGLDPTAYVFGRLGIAGTPESADATLAAATAWLAEHRPDLSARFTVDWWPGDPTERSGG